MTNRITLLGKLLDDPKSRTFERRGAKYEVVSLWIEVAEDGRTDRFTVEINDPKALNAAKAMRKEVLVEVSGKLRHDRWQHRETKVWTGKVYVAIDPGEGTIRSKGMAREAQQAEAA